VAIQFHELPVTLFSKEVRPYIARLNKELRDLFGLEGSLANPNTKQRSDSSVVRQGASTVDVSRITPSISSVVAGASTVVGVPSLTFSTTNAAGTTNTVIAIDSTVALFGTQPALALQGTSTAGTSAYAARSDHRHELTESLGTIADRALTVSCTPIGQGDSECPISYSSE